MNVLILAGLICLGCAFALVFLTGVSTIKSAENSTAKTALLFLVAGSALWIIISSLFRLPGEKWLSKVRLVSWIGPTLAVIAVSLLSFCIQSASNSARKIHLPALAVVGVPLLIVSFLLLRSEIVTETWVRDSGLLRYKLSAAGEMSLGICFAVITVAIITQFIGFPGPRQRILLPVILIFLSQASIIFPLKELALPPVFLGLAVWRYGRLFAMYPSFSDGSGKV